MKTPDLKQMAWCYIAGYALGFVLLMVFLAVR